MTRIATPRGRHTRIRRTNEIGTRNLLRNAALFAAGIALLPAGAAAEPTQGAPAAPGAAPTAQQPASPPLSDPNLLQRIDALEHTVTNLQNQLFDVREQANQPPPKTTKVSTKGGLKVESEDGAFSFQAIGRVQYDAAFYDQDKSRLGDGSQLRRGRLGAQGKLFNDWEYKFEVDFANEGTAVKDAYIAYKGWEPVEFTVGQFYEPFCLECITSDSFTTFMERALPINQPRSSFDPDRHVGIGVAHYDYNWSASAGAFMKNLADSQPANEGDQQFDVAARLTYEPIIDKGRLLHFGVSGRYSNPDDATTAFSIKPESNVTGAKFLNTGNIANVDHIWELAPEFAAVYGPASVQGEYFHVPVIRTHPNGANTPSVTLSGWYAFASYFLTGESRTYNAATARWDRLNPNRNLGSDGGWGAFELAARVSQADYDDGPAFQKGTETDYTLGLNWYANPYVKFMVNYVWVRNNATATGNSANLLPGFANDSYDDPRVLELRAQIDW
jgi:phosphate-selective porin OprO/OprP